jgi:uncharacterized membrane protein
MNKTKTQKLVGLALFTAIVVVLQLTGSFIRFGIFSISLVLVPIVVGAAVYGPKAGAWLGFVFGVVIIATGGASAFYVMGVIETVLVVLLKGSLAGLVSGLLYRLFAKKNSLLAIIVASIACPVVNTAIFTLACFTVFFPGISNWAAGEGKNMIAYVFLTLIGANFFVEVAISAVLSPVAHRLVAIGTKMRHDKSYI